jgi:hypothetical protein
MPPVAKTPGLVSNESSNNATKKFIPNHNPDPLFNLDESAVYVHLANGRVLSTILCRGTYPILNQGVVNIGRRPHFRQSTLERFIESRTVGSIA